MKWTPQPKGQCGRPDCEKDASQAGFCMNHYHLFRRNGAPYRQDEMFEMQAFNAYEREWEEVLRDEPPVIEWRKTRGGVWVADRVEDPHTDNPSRRKAA